MSRSTDSWAIVHIDDSYNASVLGSRGTKLHWCNSRAQAIEFIYDEYLAILADTGEMDGALVHAAKQRFKVLQQQAYSDAEWIENVNELTVDLRHIIWFGSIAEMAELNNDFACAVREVYWEEFGDYDEDDPSAYVPEDEWLNLSEALVEYLGRAIV
ncbi:hypothetical protein [Moritella sp.]|uniref:hypothetical protein n=1 Tax=Moritella sp. TaxID=78556 RepID=UPI001DDC1C0C|nr:hypothetical protein [Moritella sp.]MCJ8351055.1 hypothetical protein [Moritella sp.]NQZ41133.1 hypothetical protein [Moritella sp.]